MSLAGNDHCQTFLQLRLTAEILLLGVKLTLSFTFYAKDKKVRQMKKTITDYSLVLLFVGLFFFTFQFINSSISALAGSQVTTQQKISEPTIMVPGTNGDADRFDELIQKLKETDPDTAVMKVTVKTDGTLTVSGSLNQTTKHPIVVIAFQDASDGQPAVAKQAKWYQQALTYVHESYAFSNYNVVAHSNGGLVLTDYLENDRLPEDPQLDHLITLGTPFNDVGDYNSGKQLKTISPWLNSYLKNANKLPTEQLSVLNIAGDQNATQSDGTVELASVKAGAKLYQNSASYTELEVDASHSDLLTNPVAVQAIETIFH